MTIDEMQARREEIEELIRDRHHEIESLKHEYNTLANEIERIQQDRIEKITSGVKM